MPIGCCPSRSSSWFAIAINAAHNGAARLVPPPICQNLAGVVLRDRFGGRAHIRYLALRAVAVERVARQPALPRRPVLGKPSRPPATGRPRALRGRRSIPCRPKDRASDGQHVRAVRGTLPRVTRVSRRPRAHDRRRAASSGRAGETRTGPHPSSCGGSSSSCWRRRELPSGRRDGRSEIRERTTEGRRSRRPGRSRAPIRTSSSTSLWPEECGRLPRRKIASWKHGDRSTRAAHGCGRP